MNDVTPAQVVIKKPTPVLDRLGATGSLLCAIHCALLPLAIAMLPALGIAKWLGDGFEFGFVVFASCVGVFSMVWGYRRHGAVRALGLVLTGLGGAVARHPLRAAAPRTDSARPHDDPRRHARRPGAPGEPAAGPRAQRQLRPLIC